MSAYAIFLGPIAAIMVCDFWVVKSRRYDCVMLYQPRGIYQYTAGVNLHALVAFVVGTTPSLPGLIHSVNSGIEIGVGVHPYEFGWLLGFAGSAVVYLGLDYWFPYPGAKIPVAVLVDDVLDAAGNDESENVERENVTNDQEKGVEVIGK
jgi:cytosine/uracil/thiamine/allantoin permease